MDGERVLIIAVLRNPSGNFTTASRIRNCFRERSIYCDLQDPSSFHCIKSFAKYVITTKVTLVIGIHALHTGKLLPECPVPFVLVFGGTDLNIYSSLTESMSVMTSLVGQAKHLVVFSSDMMDIAIRLWPQLKLDNTRLVLIKQGVVTRSSSYNIEEVIRKYTPSPHDTHDVSADHPIAVFTLVAGIRPVKDPLYIVQVFSEWHLHCKPDALLVIIGPMMDEDYGKQFLEEIGRSSGVLYLGGLETPDAHAVIRDSTAVVNSSLSEGNSIAILEAMHLGVPVIVRDISGNKALVEDMENGLLFSSPTEFINKAELLLGNSYLRQKLVSNGSAMVERHHNCEKETESYVNLLSH